MTRFAKLRFSDFAKGVSHAVGRPIAFIVAGIILLVWAASGPLFHFSDTWQLIINTGTTIVTFLMVFLIQNTQNRDGAAMQAKLDELLHAVTAADERFIGIEHLTEKDLDKILAEVEARAQRLHGGDDQMPVVATRAEDLSAGIRKPAAKKARAPRKVSA